jgi:SHS2 domain-containing protein
MTYCMENAEFEEVEHTADMGIRSSASSLSALFANMAFGMYHLIFGSLTTRTGKKKLLQITGTSLDDLLVNWLNELNYLLFVRHYISSVFSDITIREEGTACLLNATLSGEDARKYQDHIKTEIKAVTWHQLYCKQTDTGYSAQIIFDV